MGGVTWRHPGGELKDGLVSHQISPFLVVRRLSKRLVARGGVLRSGTVGTAQYPSGCLFLFCHDARVLCGCERAVKAFSFTCGKFHHPACHGIERIVAAAADVWSGVDPRTALAHNNRAGVRSFAVMNFNSQPF